MELDLKKLNQKQKEAVCHGEGPVLIVAGAGTGKTTVITSRLAYLIRQKQAKPEEVLAVTFTEKTAEEMEERVDKLLPYGYLDLWVSTFHALARRILEEHGLEIGLPIDFKLLDETAGWLLMRQNLEKFNLDYYRPLANPTSFIRALINHFSRCKDQAIYPEDYLKYAQKLKGEEKQKINEVARAYQAYQNLLLENNFLDFGDLINYCLKLFEKRPEILKEYQKKFKYILVDEFQDTNWNQYQLIKLLATPKNNLMVVADDDQAIYRFRGASFGNIVQFRKDFPLAKQIVLIENYRSSQNILDLAYQFIQQNNPRRLEVIEKINKKLMAAKEKSGQIEHLHLKTQQQQIQAVINKIVELIKKDKQAGFNDFAVLTRTNKDANIFSLALERAGLPYQFMARCGLYSKPVILDIIAYFKLLDNYHESASVYRLLNLPFLKITPDDLARITQYSHKKALSLYQALQELNLIAEISPAAMETINWILNLIKKHSELASRKNTGEVFVAFLHHSGYLEFLAKEDKPEPLKHLNQFYDKIKTFEENNLDGRLRNFMAQLELELESGEQGKLTFDAETGPEMIRVMTVHAAKGLGFKYVFLVDLVDKKFPSTDRRELIEIPAALIKDIIPEGDVHLEEERRLFYVAMTRAKNGLFFASADDYGGVQKKKLSRFLIELGYQKPTKQAKISLAVADTINKEPLPKASQNKKEALPSHFSFTQLRAFSVCPYQYRFAHLLKVPTRGRASFSYGKTIHNVLERFLKENNKRKQTLNQLLKIYKGQWLDEWYESPRQKEEYYGVGERALKKFFADFKENKPEIVIINGRPALEQNFNLKINGSTFIGKIDRIDKAGEGVELIDYKTGAFKQKLSSDDKQQLLIYQMACEEIFKLKPEKLTYYYLDEGEKVSFLGTEKDLAEQKQKMLEQIKAIENSHFGATPGWHCRYCDFKEICGYAE